VEKPSGALDVKLALAFSYMNQSKMTEFNDLKNEILKNYGARERLLVALARFTQATGDGAGALGIYEIAMQARSKNGNSQKPEWFDDYSELQKTKASE
jgi:Tfp pilus assembly protein PilF